MQRTWRAWLIVLGVVVLPLGLGFLARDAAADGVKDWVRLPVGTEIEYRGKSRMEFGGVGEPQSEPQIVESDVAAKLQVLSQAADGKLRLGWVVRHQLKDGSNEMFRVRPSAAILVKELARNRFQPETKTLPAGAMPSLMIGGPGEVQPPFPELDTTMVGTPGTTQVKRAFEFFGIRNDIEQRIAVAHSKNAAGERVAEVTIEAVGPLPIELKMGGPEPAEAAPQNPESGAGEQGEAKKDLQAEPPQPAEKPADGQAAPAATEVDDDDVEPENPQLLQFNERFEINLDQGRVVAFRSMTRIGVGAQYRMEREVELREVACNKLPDDYLAELDGALNVLHYANENMQDVAKMRAVAADFSKRFPRAGLDDVAQALVAQAEEFAAWMKGDAAGDEKLQKLVGQPAPDFTLNGLDGQPVSLASFKGKVVLLTFWGVG